MFASHKGCIVGDEVVVGQGFVNSDAVALDLQDHGVGVSRERSDHVQLDRLRGPHAYGQGVRGGEFGCVVRVDDSRFGKDPR